MKRNILSCKVNCFKFRKEFAFCCNPGKRVFLQLCIHRLMFVWL